MINRKLLQLFVLLLTACFVGSTSAQYEHAHGDQAPVASMVSNECNSDLQTSRSPANWLIAPVAPLDPHQWVAIVSAFGDAIFYLSIPPVDTFAHATTIAWQYQQQLLLSLKPYHHLFIPPQPILVDAVNAA